MFEKNKDEEFKIFYQNNLARVNSSFFEEKKEIFASPQIIIIRSGEETPFNWTGIIAYEFSRIFSHQFVRYTWLNFNQRSHRYTKVDRFVIPESFDENAISIYREVIKDTMKVYEELIRENKKRRRKVHSFTGSFNHNSCNSS